MGWLPNRHERRARKLTMAFARGYAQGFTDGSLEMKEYLAEQIIYALNKDGILTMAISADNLERVVEIIEAVRDIGKA
jgi:ribosomal protein S7